MYSSNANDYHKYPESLPPAPSFGGQLPTTGIPVSFYTESAPLAPLQIESKPEVPWSTGLCDCRADLRNCCITFWCPCITFGHVAEIVDKGSSSCGVNGALYTLMACVTGCPCFYSCFYRTKLRKQYSLKKSPCGDCLVHCFCGCCALCQEYRELRDRGFDMSIGWHGNLEKQTKGIMAMAPVTQEGMSRD